MRIYSSLRNVVVALAVLATSAAAFAQFGISVSFGPPALPVYEQPVCPQEGFLWTPGYWAYDYDFGDYYWVPGTWVEAPEVGYLWTPGYWGWGGNGYFFHEGYWGQQVGFYGGINYGYGFFGDGFQGGRWDGGRFFYNRSAANVNVVNIRNVYNTTIINNTTINRVSYNGGEGGITVRPTPLQEEAARQRHIPPQPAQLQHVQMAKSNPQLRASANNGRPPIAATARPGAFTGGGALPAREAGAPYHPPANRPVASRPAGQPAPSIPMHASELQSHQAPAPVSSGNEKADNKYQQQQEKLVAKQNQQHEQLQQKQEQDHQRLVQQNANDARKQQVEQQHQQQTQQLEQKHVQQQQHMEQRQPQPAHNEGRR